MKKQLGLTTGSLIARVNRYEFQFDLFDKANLSRTLAEHNKFELTEAALEKTRLGVSIKLDDLGNYKLVKRETPVSIYERSDGNYGGSNYSHSAAVGLNEMTRDETKLFLTGQLACSVEHGEITPFASAF